MPGGNKMSCSDIGATEVTHISWQVINNYTYISLWWPQILLRHRDMCTYVTWQIPVQSPTFMTDYAPTNMHTHKHAHTQACPLTNMHTHKHANTQTCTHRHTHTQKHAHTRTHTHKHAHTNMQTQAWTHKHAHTQTCTLTNLYTQTYTHKHAHSQTCTLTNMHTHRHV